MPVNLHAIFHMHCKRLLLALAMFVTSIMAHAQLTDTAMLLRRYLNDSAIRAVVKKTLWQEAANNKVEREDFEARFSGGYLPLLRGMEPMLKEASAAKAVQWPYAADAKPGTRNFDRVKAAMEQILAESTLARLRSEAYQRSLVLPDYSDRILTFHSDVIIAGDGTLDVTEHITIFNGDGQQGPGYDEAVMGFINDDIRRGIVRDIPTSYQLPNGLVSKVGFELIAVTKNGQPEPHLVAPLGNGKRIFIGSKDGILDKGIYHYTIRYRTDRQLIFHDNKVECYWNVNGNGWVFSADSVSCRILFPEGANIIETACYTGTFGSTESECRLVRLSDREIWFSTSKRLVSYEGLTVAASVAPGILAAPGAWEKRLALLRDNYALPVLAAIILLMLCWYLLTWLRHGRDPEKGTIIPQFEPPAGLSPADVGFIHTQKYHPRLFAAALVDCAVHNLLRIEVKKEGQIFKSTSYHFLKPAADKKPGAMPYATSSLYDFDAESFHGEVVQSGTYNAFIFTRNEALRKKLQQRFEIRRGQANSWKGLFSLNKGFLAVGLLLLLIGLIVTIVFVVSYQNWAIIKWAATLWGMALVIHIIFSRIMSAYTQHGRGIADHIEGFKLYLETAEQKLFEHFTPPAKTLELFEKYLPYAIALGVENSWAEKFDNLLQQAMSEGYRPNYYSGSGGSFSNSFRPAAISQSISSGLSSSISSASTPPSSSSGGSSGGGSSGGGGGGGGGGGW